MVIVSVVWLGVCESSLPLSEGLVRLFYNRKAELCEPAHEGRGIRVEYRSGASAHALANPGLHTPRKREANRRQVHGNQRGGWFRGYYPLLGMPHRPNDSCFKPTHPIGCHVLSLVWFSSRGLAGHVPAREFSLLSRVSGGQRWLVATSPLE